MLRSGVYLRLAKGLLLALGACATAAPAAAQTSPLQYREYIYAGAQLLAYQANFSDVRPDKELYRFINIIANAHITVGCGGSNYCPDASVTRDTMAVFLLLSKEGTLYVPPACTTQMFADVPTNNMFCPWIQELANRGVVTGCGAGNYCPTAAVTRAQMAVFLLRTLEPTLNPPACVPPNDFSDVSEASPFCPWIEELKRRGIVTGCGVSPPRYCPANPVTRGSMAVFLTVTFSIPGFAE